MTAKYWGRGPEYWIPSLIAAKILGTIEIEAVTPPATIGLPSAAESPLPEGSVSVIDPPTQLCRWSIHYCETIKYDPAPSPPREPHQEQDIEDESTWTPWANPENHPTPTDTMKMALSKKFFSPINEERLAFSISSIINAVNRSKDQIKADSWGFAIMARNVEILRDYLEPWGARPPKTLQNLYPFHLAAAYLDGANSCCLMLDFLMGHLEDEQSLVPNYRNDLGHTVLDSLMVNILRSNTSVTPQLVSEHFRAQNRFPGEEVDICGRWDADSKCIRQLYASGRSTVPFEWKHVFCHTSAQVICHSITAIFAPRWCPDIDAASGLFSRRCRGCGADLKLLPLHTLVLVAYYLANNGTEGETMFGIIACLVCMLVHGADPTRATDLSIPALLGEDVGENCTHTSIVPSELASHVPEQIIDSWPSDRRLG